MSLKERREEIELKCQDSIKIFFFNFIRKPQFRKKQKKDNLDQSDLRVNFSFVHKIPTSKTFTHLNGGLLKQYGHRG